MRKALMVAAALLAMAAPARAQEAFPFVGAWACEGNLFDFSSAGFTPPGGTLRAYKRVDQKGDVHTIVFEDDETLLLMKVRPQSMIWYWPQSGDVFLCERARAQDHPEKR